MMKENSSIDEGLLVKYLLEEVTDDEAERVRKWLEQSESNRQYFGQFKQIWDNSLLLAAENPADENEAWTRFRARVQHAGPQNTGSAGRFGWIRIAAAVLLFTAMGWYGISYYRSAIDVSMLQVSSADHTVTDTLPDGSVIMLNRNSRLSYPSRFKGDKRLVSLEGEAFFNVEKDASKPFVISINDVTVTVKGTSFNVKSRNAETEIIVESGVVQVSRKEKLVELKAGERVKIRNGKNELLKEHNTGKLYNYYRSHKFVCESTPVAELAELFEEVYNVEIVLADPAIASKQITTVFGEEPIDDKMTIIAQTFKLNLRHEGNRYILN